MDNQLSEELQQRLAELQEIFHQQLPGKIDELTTVWRQLNKQWAVERLSQLHSICHSLAGSAGTFGAHEVSRQAHTLEQHIKQLAAAGVETDEASTKARQQLGQQINALAQSTKKWTPTHNGVEE